MDLSPRQELILRKVVDGYVEAGQPVGSKALTTSGDVTWGASTVRHELAVLEEQGLLAHPHTSAGRVPTDAGYRYFVDRLLPERATAARQRRSSCRWCAARSTRRCALTTETLSQVTNLLAIVSAPPIETTTIRHVEVLAAAAAGADGGDHHLDRRRLQARAHLRLARSTRGSPTGPAATSTSASSGMGLGARMLHLRALEDPALSASERGFLADLAPAFTELAETAEDTLYVDGAARLLAEHRWAGPRRRSTSSWRCSSAASRCSACCAPRSPQR